MALTLVTYAFHGLQKLVDIYNILDGPKKLNHFMKFITSVYDNVKAFHILKCSVTCICIVQSNR